VIYVGDPMCSWCWGVSPATHAAERHCAEKGITFRIAMGGLRVGGGDPWNESFKSFLRNEWTRIEQRTGQPFGYRLLERSFYNYDTEPACRAVVVAREILGTDIEATREIVAFFASVQRKFYVDGADPSEPAFYRDLCVTHGIEIERFDKAFNAPEAKAATLREFQSVRRLGVRGFPTFLVQRAETTAVLASGYVTVDTLVSAIDIVMR